VNAHSSKASPTGDLPNTAIEGFDSLTELALDIRSSWNHAADNLWHALDPAVWNLTHNPWTVLQAVSQDHLKKMLADTAFRRSAYELIQDRERILAKPAWFQRNHPKAPLACIAYFSMEFMLSEGLPIYSGGLGNVAGDQLKAAGDLGVPVVGVGLLYQQGYFHQVIDKDGAQQALYPYNDPAHLPITPLYHPNGDRLRLEIALPGYSVWVRAWQVPVGHVTNGVHMPSWDSTPADDLWTEACGKERC
jgi:starch phosphorylase